MLSIGSNSTTRKGNSRSEAETRALSQEVRAGDELHKVRWYLSSRPSALHIINTRCTFRYCFAVMLIAQDYRTKSITVCLVFVVLVASQQPDTRGRENHNQFVGGNVNC